MKKIKIIIALNVLILLEKIQYKFQIDEYSNISKLLGYFFMKERIKQYKISAKKHLI
jgi:hypothetical protein